MWFHGQLPRILVAMDVSVASLVAMSLIHSFHANFIFAQIRAILTTIFFGDSIVSMPVTVAVVMPVPTILVPMALLGQQPMRVLIASVEDHIHENIDSESRNGSDEHDGGVLDEVSIEDPLGSLVDDEDHEQPDDEEIGKGSQELHAVVAKGDAFVHGLLGKVEEDEGEDEAHQVAHQVDGVRDDGDGTRNFATDDLPRDEDQGDGDDCGQTAVVLGTVLRRGWVVERAHLLTLADLFHFN